MKIMKKSEIIQKHIPFTRKVKKINHQHFEEKEKIDEI